MRDGFVIFFITFLHRPSDSRALAIFELLGNTDKSASIQINILVNALYNHTKRAR